MWDVGGQKSLRSYWRNYFESTDGLVWVVDSADRMRLADCKRELHNLLVEEVKPVSPVWVHFPSISPSSILERGEGGGCRMHGPQLYLDVQYWQTKFKIPIHFDT